MAFDLENLLSGDELSDPERQQLFAELAQRGEQLHFNGVDGATGQYGLPPMSGAAFAELLRRAPAHPESEQQECAARSDPGNRAHPIRPGHDPSRLDDAGWAVIFPAQVDSTPYQEALKPLLAMRRDQAGGLFRVFEGAQGYRPGEEKRDFFKRNRIAEGSTDPKQLPYYVLLVGSPEEIPFSFQFQLDLMRGVGRIHFDDLKDYARYAASVVRAERADVKLPRQVGFFGTSNPDDKATEMSARYLIQNLYQTFAARAAESGTDKLAALWKYSLCLKEEATKANLARLLGGESRPAILFTASHGVEFPKGDPLQLQHQGALLCQNWPGPRGSHEDRIPKEYYFSGDDASGQKNLLGMIALCFACYGAGVPKLDQFAPHDGSSARAEIAPCSFVSRLPAKLLSHPEGGALAVLGHVERAWGYSFLSPDSTAHTNAFEDALRELMSGQRIGWATESLNLRYADKATELSGVLNELSYEGSAPRSPYELAGLWTACNDARGYVILGDPAVRLSLTSPPPNDSAAAQAAAGKGAPEAAPP